MFRRFAQLGTYVVLTAGLIFQSGSNVQADACWDHWRAKLEVFAAVNDRYLAQLKATGDCSYIDKMMENKRRHEEVLRAVPCKNIWKEHVSYEQARAMWTRYCKGPVPEARPTESAS